MSEADKTAGEAPAQRDARLAWWREARFGLFIHWGLYAIPAGEWRGLEKQKRLGAEWLMFNAHVPVAEYEPLATQFNPVKFDADAWVRTAREAGMKYLVITAKHCDGFAMFRSKASAYNIVDATPFGRDPIAELADACARHGVKLGLYYSHSWDWHEPDAADDPRFCNTWDFKPREQRDVDRYFRAKSLPQVEELLAQYKPALVWFDVPNLSRAWSETFLDAIRRRLPDCVANNRVGNGLGDYETPEQFIPRERLGGDFEVCMTLNAHWGYDRNDHAWKSPRTVIRFLADIVAKGGNLLLNVGPTAEGVFPPESIRILHEVGKWMRINGASIHGTQASPLPRVPWGVCTRAPGKLFLHVFEWPADGRLFVPGLRNAVTAASLLADGTPLSFDRLGDRDWMVRLPAQAPDTDDTVVELEFRGEPDVDRTLPLLPAGAMFYASAAEVRGATAKYLPRSMKRREYDFVGSWTDPADRIEWSIRALAPGVYEATAVIGAPPAWAGNRFALAVGGEERECEVRSTGEAERFETVTVGRFEIAKPGAITLAIRPVSIGPGAELMNLHAVTLTAVSGQP